VATQISWDAAQGIALLVPPGCILRVARQKVNREIRVSAVQDFQGLPKAFALKRQHHQKVYVGVWARVPVRVGTKQDDSLRLELAGNPLAQVGDFLLVNHLLLPAAPERMNLCEAPWSAAA